VKTITPIKAPSRSPTASSLSVERGSSPASSAVSTGVLPLPSFWRGAFTESAALCWAGDLVVEEHADGGHVLLEGGVATGLGSFDCAAARSPARPSYSFPALALAMPSHWRSR